MKTIAAILIVVSGTAEAPTIATDHFATLQRCEAAALRINLEFHPAVPPAVLGAPAWPPGLPMAYCLPKPAQYQ